MGFQAWIERPSEPKGAVCVDPVSWSLQSLSFTPDGKSLVALNQTAEILVHDAATGGLQRRFPISGVSQINRVMVLSPSSSRTDRTSPAAAIERAERPSR